MAINKNLARQIPGEVKHRRGGTLQQLHSMAIQQKIQAMNVIIPF
jgi:hypothetical protein